MAGHLETVIVDATLVDVLELPGVQIAVRNSANLVAADELSSGAWLEIDIAYDPGLGRIVAESVTVDRAGEGAEVTARLLREVRVQENIVAVAMHHMVQVHRGADGDAPDDWRTHTGQEELDRILPMRDRPRAAVVEDAAIVYVLASLASWPPLKTVADRLQVSQSTATRLVAESGVRSRLGER